MSYDADCYCEDNEGIPCVFCEMETDYRLRKLGANLVMAGALTYSFELGRRAHAWNAGGILRPDDPAWVPGCGREP